MEWVPIIFVIFKGTILFTGMYFAIKWHYDQDRKTKNDASSAQSSGEMRLFATMITAFALSLVGIVYGGCWGNAADAGCGGALGFAFAMVMLFLSKPGDILAAAAPETPGEGAEQWHAALAIRRASAQREKIYLGVAILVSVLAWKYGDMAAAGLKF